MELWEVTYDCGDYYCEGSHIVGVFTTEQKAKDAIGQFKEERADPKKFDQVCNADKYDFTVTTIETDRVYHW